MEKSRKAPEIVIWVPMGASYAAQEEQARGWLNPATIDALTHAANNFGISKLEITPGLDRDQGIYKTTLYFRRDEVGNTSEKLYDVRKNFKKILNTRTNICEIYSNPFHRAQYEVHLYYKYMAVPYSIQPVKELYPITVH